MSTKNIVPHLHSVTKELRSERKKQQPCVLWFTGLSGSGKSTISSAVELKLYQRGHHTYLLDGDNVRHGINKDLAFSDEDRIENIRRIGELAKLFTDAGIIVLTAFISPFRADRRLVRQLFGDGEFIEVHMDTPLDECERRDSKGLYKKARAGEIKSFTGIDSNYELPEAAEITVKTAELGIEACADQIIDYLIANQLIGAARV
ncbi:MAG: adenylyl-sulfate kinase [Gammaproteobacteria bacterium]|nr:MAG: adenylyl-sulfate kinase [Gammaproteobacteria bacterium]